MKVVNRPDIPDDVAELLYSIHDSYEDEGCDECGTISEDVFLKLKDMIHPQKESTMKQFFVLQVNELGIPTSLQPVESKEAGIKYLKDLAVEQEIVFNQDNLHNEPNFETNPIGFFVSQEDSDATGCWLIESN